MRGMLASAAHKRMRLKRETVEAYEKAKERLKEGITKSIDDDAEAARDAWLECVDQADADAMLVELTKRCQNGFD